MSEKEHDELKLLLELKGKLDYLINVVISGDETILAALKPRNTALKLTIPNQKGETMGAPVSLTVAGGPVQATVVETLGGVPQNTFNGPIAFTSDNPAAATVDPASGLVTPVGAGVANIKVTDAVGNLSDTVAVTVTAVTPPTLNDGLTLTIPAQIAKRK